MSFSEIRLAGGTLLINDEATGTIETLDAVELSLAWPSISRSFGATGQFVWRGEQVDASVSLGDFLAALNGERSGFKVRSASATVEARLRRSPQPQADAEGRGHAGGRQSVAARVRCAGPARSRCQAVASAASP